MHKRGFTMDSGINREKLLQIMQKYGNEAQQITAILHDVNNASGKNYVDEQWVALISETIGVPVSKIYELITFYSMLSTKPRGRCLVEICQSTPCHFRRAQQVVGWFEEELGIKNGETSSDGEFTLGRTSCVGACDVGPVAKIGDDVFGDLTRDKVASIIKSYRDNKPELREGLICQN